MKMRMVEFPIYFSDLNEDAQKRLLNVVQATDPSEMNWDMDIVPIAQFDVIGGIDKEEESKNEQDM